MSSAAVHDLLRLAEHLSRLDEPWASEMARRIDRVLEGEPADRALGLRPRPGQRKWRSIGALDRRDALLRQAADRFYRGMSPTRQADAISRELRRYASTGWRHERSDTRCPHDPASLKAHLWLALQEIDHALSAARLRKILAG